MIAFLMIAGLGVLALLSRFAALTRMTIPLLYTVSMLTVFHGWYRAHTSSQSTRERRRHRQHRGSVALNQPRPISSRMMRSLILIAPTSTSILKISSPT